MGMVTTESNRTTLERERGRSETYRRVKVMPTDAVWSPGDAILNPRISKVIHHK